MTSLSAIEFGSSVVLHIKFLLASHKCFEL
jgi:hypothetical protein